MGSLVNLEPIYVITGPPAAGKTTLCLEILSRLGRGIHVHVDDIRTWVVSGLADSVPWTDETEAQFQVAEAATIDIAIRYQDAGFAVAIDHCRNLPRLEEVTKRLAGRPFVKICLMPDLETNLQRNRERTNKSFDPTILEETIAWTNTNYRKEIPPGWLVLDTAKLTPSETADIVMRYI